MAASVQGDVPNTLFSLRLWFIGKGLILLPAFPPLQDVVLSNEDKGPRMVLDNMLILIDQAYHYNNATHSFFEFLTELI